MSDEQQLSRLIAEFLEPKPVFEKSGLQYDRWNSLCWWKPVADSLVDYEDQEPRPRDMIHDPAMTVMLLEKLLDPNADHTCIIGADEIEMGLSRRYVDRVSMKDLTKRSFMVSLVKVKLGRAVAEAFALANNLK